MIVVVFKNYFRLRLRRLGTNPIDASDDLGIVVAEFRYITVRSDARRTRRRGDLAFALSFDEIVVTTFTAGPHRPDVAIGSSEKPFRPNQAPSSTCRRRVDRARGHFRSGWRSASAAIRPVPVVTDSCGSNLFICELYWRNCANTRNLGGEFLRRGNMRERAMAMDPTAARANIVRTRWRAAKGKTHGGTPSTSVASERWRYPRRGVAWRAQRDSVCRGGTGPPVNSPTPSSRVDHSHKVSPSPKDASVGDEALAEGQGTIDGREPTGHRVSRDRGRLFFLAGRGSCVSPRKFRFAPPSARRGSFGRPPPPGSRTDAPAAARQPQSFGAVVDGTHPRPGRRRCR